MKEPNFKHSELLPAIIQDFYTREVLMLGYMNEEAYKKTLDEQTVTFFSRSRQKLWMKGETSGNFLRVKKLSVDCDNDTILVEAVPEGPVCHTGSATCFSEKNEDGSLKFLEEVISSRKEKINDQKSYTATLFREGPKKIAQKVGEEAVELALEAMDNNDEEFLNEAADLMFHYLVLLQAKDYQLKDVISLLKERHKEKR